MLMSGRNSGSIKLLGRTDSNTSRLPDLGVLRIALLSRVVGIRPGMLSAPGRAGARTGRLPLAELQSALSGSEMITGNCRRFRREMVTRVRRLLEMITWDRLILRKVTGQRPRRNNGFIGLLRRFGYQRIAHARLDQADRVSGMNHAAECQSEAERDVGVLVRCRFLFKILLIHFARIAWVVIQKSAVQTGIRQPFCKYRKKVGISSAQPRRVRHKYQARGYGS